MPSIEIKSEQEFNRHCKTVSGKPVVVDFTATWCGPCKMMAPVYEQLSLKFPGITFLKVDVDANQAIARELGIRSMPTFVIFAKGKLQESIMGADPSALEFLLNKYKDYQPTFSGTGRKLTDELESNPVASTVNAANAVEIQLDESQPTTLLQIRMADGSRFVAKFNTTSTVGQLRSHIRSLGGPAMFSLVMAGIPPRPVTAADSESLQAAGLEGSVIIQRA